MTLRSFSFWFWLVVAWCTPAIIADIQGWHGIWGSGNVLLDYLIPIPVAGGVLHVPSIVLVGVLLLAGPQLSPSRRPQLRPLLMGMSLLGIAMLVDMEKLFLQLTTDLHGGNQLLPWQENPLGLFLLTDSLLAQLFLSGYSPQWPAQARQWLSALLIIAGPPALYTATWMGAGSRGAAPFMFGSSMSGDAFDDETTIVFTRLDPAAPDFRDAAIRYATQRDPAQDVNVSDLAVVFVRSLDAARNRNLTDVAATYCLYEDGTPPLWTPGPADCFSGHENFDERWRRLRAADPRPLPEEVSSHLALIQACAGVTPETDPFINGRAAESWCARIDARRAEILKQYGSDPAVAEAMDE